MATTAARVRKNHSPEQALAKAPTGIKGLDEITDGGIPRGRPTLVCGTAGCGKTLLAMEFLVRGVMDHNEPGVFMSFEESAEDLAKNVSSLGFDLKDLEHRKKLLVDYVRIERSEIEETGEYDLDGLFVRLAYAIDVVKARRVALDTIEALFGELPNPGILRAEIRRLFNWLRSKGVTAVITAERGEGSLTRHGLEEYVSDCVILLDHRVRDQVSTRRLRVVKYRGSQHGTNEYPFIIDDEGISVLPLSSLRLEHKVSPERISTGIERLDRMMGGEGFYRGSSVLVSGTAGVGKSSLLAHFADATCRRGERVLYFAFEESPDQIVRNMRSIGIDLGRWVRKGLLHFHATRPTFGGLEQHLVIMHKLMREVKPSAVLIDPITNLIAVGTTEEVRSMLMRLIDTLKNDGVTGMFSSLTGGGDALEATEVGVSSLMDTWILLKMIEIGGERNRGLYVLKSRGMPHSNQVREFMLTDRGVKLRDVYLGPEGVLTGSARIAQEAREKAAATIRQQEIQRKQRDLQRKREIMQAQIKALQVAYEAEREELERSIIAERERETVLLSDRDAMAALRGSDERAKAARKT